MAEGHDGKQAREAFEAAERNKNEPIPEAEQGGHTKSHAAHLQAEGHTHNSAEGSRKQGSEPGALKEPPQDPRTQGKAFRNQ